MKTSDLLQLSIFEKSKLLTPNLHVNNTIESVMVLEAIDIEKWAKRNQLILTSFYALNNLSIEQIDSMFQKMEKIGISGIVIKVDRLITMVPEWFIKYCYKYKIPLIKIKGDLTYEQIMVAIYQPILNQKQAILESYYNSRQKILSFVNSFTSYQSIINDFSRMIGMECSLILPKLEISVKSSGFKTEFMQTKSSPYPDSYLHYVKNRYTSIVLSSLDNSQCQNSTLIEFSSTVSGQCKLYVYHKKSFLDEENVMIFENFIDVIQNKIQTEFILKKEKYNHLNQVADVLLENTPTDLMEIEQLLKETKMAKYKYYQAISLCTKKISNDVSNKVLKLLNNAYPNTLYREYQGFTIILVNFENEDYRIKASRIESILNAYLSSYQLNVVISKVKTRETLSTVMNEVVKTLEFTRTIPVKKVTDIEYLGIFNYFVNESNIEEYERYIPDKLRTLAKEQPVLFETLKTWFANDKNYQITSEQMYVHVKTIRYRLKKIEQLLGSSFSDPLTNINYQISAYLLSIEKSDGTYEQ